MSTDYTDTLKKIKESEEAGSRELLEKRKALEENLRKMEDESASAIAAAKKQAEQLVASEVEKARKAAQKQADVRLASTSKEANDIASRRLDKAALKKIVDKTILSEFK